MKQYDNLIIDYGSIDLVLASDASKRGDDIYDRRQAVADFVSEVIEATYLADEYHVAIHDPSTCVETVMDHPMIHVACRLWESLGWSREWTFGSSSLQTASMLVRRFSENRQSTLLVGSDIRLLELLGPSIEVLFVEGNMQSKHWTDDRFCDEFGFRSELLGVFLAAVNVVKLGTRPLMSPDQASRTLAGYESVDGFFQHPPPGFSSEQIDLLRSAILVASV